MSPFDDSYISAEIQKRAELSQRQVAEMVNRALRCPHCNFVMGYAYDNNHSGHIALKCPKCKNISTLNLGLFKCQAEPKKYPGVHTLPDFAY